MLRATGSASCVQTGMVAATHSSRVKSRGVVVRSEIDVASPNHKAASDKAFWSSSRSDDGVAIVAAVAMVRACAVAGLQLIPSPPCCIAAVS